MKRIGSGLCVAVLVFSVVVKAQWLVTSSPQPRPEYKVLDTWAGEWNIQGEVKDSPSGPAYKFDWTLKGQRILGGFFLEVHHTWKAQGTVQNWLEVTGYDLTKKACMTYTFCDDGSWTISTPTFINERTCIEDCTAYYPDGRVIKWRNIWSFSSDLKTLSVKAENETDGKWWTSLEGNGIRPKAK